MSACFVSTTFESPQPEVAAAEIARRIASRIACIRAEQQGEQDNNTNDPALNTSYASSLSSHILGL